jgi:hypothetical protein
MNKFKLLWELRKLDNNWNELQRRRKMGLKFNPISIGAAGVMAGASAWNLAANNATPGVQPGEYLGILFAVVPSVFGTLFHSDTTPKQ